MKRRKEAFLPGNLILDSENPENKEMIQLGNEILRIQERIATKRYKFLTATELVLGEDSPEAGEARKLWIRDVRRQQH